MFPPKTHALAGAVFNVVAQLGTSIGLAVMAAVSSAYAKGADAGEGEQDLLRGYRAVAWACFGMMCLSCCMAPFGLRSVGRLGME